jgi:hypothetical protein
MVTHQRRVLTALRGFLVVTLLGISEAAAADCISGEILLEQGHAAKPAVGKETFRYLPRDTKFQLLGRPDFADTQIFVMAFHAAYPFGAAAVMPSDWCYDVENNSVRFTADPPHMRGLGEDLGEIQPTSEIWVGYFSSADYDPQCIRGQYLEGLPSSLEARTYESFPLADASGFTLAKPARLDRGLMLRTALRGSARNVFPDDWCYEPATGKISFLRMPPRLYELGATPGEEAHDYDVIWVQYEAQP